MCRVNNTILNVKKENPGEWVLKPVMKIELYWLLIFFNYLVLVFPLLNQRL